MRKKTWDEFMEQMEGYEETDSMSESEYWETLSRGNLTDEEVNLFAPYLNWSSVSETANLSHFTWVKHSDYINKKWFTKNEHVSAHTFNALKEKVDWEEMAKKRRVDEDFLLQIGVNFQTFLFATENKQARFISHETWEKVYQKNKELMMNAEEHERPVYLRMQIFSPATLSTFAAEWDNSDWRVISKIQPIDLKFAKKHLLQLDFDFVKRNPLHTIPTEMFEKLKSNQAFLRGEEK